MRARLVAAALAACLLAGVAQAQTPAVVRVRGTIATMEGAVMTVKARGGEMMPITLDERLSVSTVKPVDLGSVTPGTYVGTASRPGPDGRLEALEVLVFPEAMRGVGEGHRPWDLEPGSLMTNAAVSGAVQSANGRDLTLTYKDGTQAVHVPPKAPVVTLAPAERADLKPGAPVFLTATKDAAGKLSASRVTVGTNGVAPPM